MIRRMLVADDGSPSGERAFVAALDLARRLSVSLDMICVEELPRFPATIDEVEEERADIGGAFAKVVEAAKAKAAAVGVAFAAHIVAGHPVSSIAEFVERRGYDLLVVGFMGHSTLYNRVIGSVSDRLVDLARCTVMVVK
jgi:nucleotide-binding universal stress UspA family protein